jgi:hypothetical protein
LITFLKSETPQEFDVVLEQYGTVNHIDAKKKSQFISGELRNELKDKAKYMTAVDLRGETIDNINRKKAAEKNIGKVASKNVFQKIRQESMADQDHSKDDLDDLEGFKHDELRGYIQQIGSDPFWVVLRDSNMIKLCDKKRKSNKLNIACLDASGGFVKNFKGKKVLYHALTTHFQVEGNPTGDLVEVTGMLTVSQGQVSIGTFLSQFHLQVATMHISWPLFTDIVSDFSYANLNAISLSWNGLELTKYVEKFYLYWLGEIDSEALKQYTRIHLCVRHLLESFELNAKKHFKDRQIQKNVKKIMGNFMLIRSYEAYSVYLENVIKLFTIETTTDPEYDRVYQLIATTSLQQDVDVFLKKFDKNYDNIEVIKFVQIYSNFTTFDQNWSLL